MTKSQPLHGNAGPLSSNQALVNALAISPPNQQVQAILKVINFLNEGIFVLNQHGIIEALNSLAADFFAAPKDQLIGQRWFGFLHQRFQEEYEYLFATRRNHSSYEFNYGPQEILLKRADGSNLEADLSLSGLPGFSANSGHLIVGVLHNLSRYKRQYTELRRQASTDHLTELANRYDLDKKLRQPWQRCADNGLPLSLIVIDVDYFKYFNQQFGHHSGERCLQKISEMIELCLPGQDSLVSRYGSEEFAVILPGYAIDHTRQLAARIQQKISQLTFTDLGLPASFSVSVSQGIACEQNGQYRNSEALIFAADTALLRAKSEGRNRIHISL